MNQLKKMLLSLLCIGGLVGCVLAGEGSIKDLSSDAKIGKFAIKSDRTAGYPLVDVPAELAGLPTVFMPRGDGKKFGAEFSFSIDAPATVFLCVHNRGKVTIPADWIKTSLKSGWSAGGNKIEDTIYKKDFPAGKVEIPAHNGTDGGMFGVPDLAVIKFGKDTTVTAAAASANAGVAVTALSNGGKTTVAKLKAARVTDEKYGFSKIPVELENQVCVYVPRGNSAQEGIAYSFVINQPAVVYLLVHIRGNATIPSDWTKTDMKTSWTVGGANYDDVVYKKEFPAGKVEIPAHTGKDVGGAYGVPNAAIIKAK